jgi:hypothetical protein
MDASDALFLGLFGRLLLYWLRLINEVSGEKNTKSKKKKAEKSSLTFLKNKLSKPNPLQRINATYLG